ncbi:MAG TPA: septum formation initiator family protein [Roseiflexaceae bacterium]|nr:septum formation initiator family protein [Roseiflexaceae bacterium]
MRRSGQALVASWVSQGADWGRSGLVLVTIGLVLLSLLLLGNFVNQVILSAQMDRQRDQVQAEIAQIQDENQQLSTSVAMAQSADYAEQVAREQLGYARQGDVVVVPVLPQATPQSVEATPVPVAVAQPEPNWQGWLHSFFPPASP